MKKTEKLVPQVLLRRMILVLLDAAIVIFSFYFALLLRADGAVEAAHAALKRGAGIVTDTNMARAGINKTALGKLGG
uniref:precorrin-8X methylmutase n=1 Tax=Faecalibacterium sp. TaxID=1971605 RepID=UPI003FEE2F2C